MTEAERRMALAAWIRTPGNIWAEDAIDECARLLENNALALASATVNSGDSGTNTHRNGSGGIVRGHQKDTLQMTEYKAIAPVIPPVGEDEMFEIQSRLEAASQGQWTAYRMTHHERGDDLTPDEVGEYVKNSVVKSVEASGSSSFLFVSVEKEDGSVDVCHVGNGPTSPQNADFIQHAPGDVRWLLAALILTRQQHVEREQVLTRAVQGNALAMTKALARHAEDLSLSRDIIGAITDRVEAAEKRAEALAEQIAEKDQDMARLERIATACGRTADAHVVELLESKSREAALRAELEQSQEARQRNLREVLRLRREIETLKQEQDNKQRLDEAWCVCGHSASLHGNDGTGHCGATRACRKANGCRQFTPAPVEQEQAWQPIETCPDDGTWFLGYLDGECSVVRTWKGWAPDDWTPTHWMPLPPPPVEQEKGTTTP